MLSKPAGSTPAVTTRTEPTAFATRPESFRLENPFDPQNVDQRAAPGRAAHLRRGRQDPGELPGGGRRPESDPRQHLPRRDLEHPTVLERRLHRLRRRAQRLPGHPGRGGRRLVSPTEEIQVPPPHRGRPGQRPAHRGPSDPGAGGPERCRADHQPEPGRPVSGADPLRRHPRHLPQGGVRQGPPAAQEDGRQAQDAQELRRHRAHQRGGPDPDHAEPGPGGAPQAVEAHRGRGARGGRQEDQAQAPLLGPGPGAPSPAGLPGQHHRRDPGGRRRGLRARPGVHEGLHAPGQGPAPALRRAPAPVFQVRDRAPDRPHLRPVRGAALRRLHRHRPHRGADRRRRQLGARQPGGEPGGDGGTDQRGSRPGGGPPAPAAGPGRAPGGGLPCAAGRISARSKRPCATR